MEQVLGSTLYVRKLNLVGWEETFFLVEEHQTAQWQAKYRLSIQLRAIPLTNWQLQPELERHPINLLSLVLLRVLDLRLWTERLPKTSPGRLRVNWTGTCGEREDDTFVFLIFRRLQQLDKFNIDVKLHSNDQGDLQQDQLQLLNTCETKTHSRSILQSTVSTLTTFWDFACNIRGIPSDLSMIFRNQRLTDVVKSAGAEFAVKLLGSESS